jgi:crossover junction endodeoxyribonuclease RusA
MKTDFFLPFPPSINSYYTKTRNGVYLSKTGRCFQSSGILSIREQLGDHPQIDFPIHLSIILYPPTKISRDLDNYIKPVQDCIQNSGLLYNDCLVNQLEVFRGEITPKGSVFVRIREAAPVLHNTAEDRALI